MKNILSFAVLIFCAGITVHAQNKTIQRDSFSLKYPSNWTIDTADEDYDADALFSLDSPDGDNMIMFMIFDRDIDKKEMMDAQIEAFSSELIKKPEISSFTDWGKYKGTGKILKGKLLGVFKGFVRIFIWGDGNKTLLVVEQCYDTAYKDLKKDYDLMSSSFSFK